MSAKPDRRWTDERVERTIGTLLRVGVVAAAVLVAIGGAIHLARHGGEPTHLRVFHGEPADLRTLPGIVRDALDLRGAGWIQLGLVVLLATPIARVAFSVVAFALEGDRLYVGVTLVVLAVLIASLFGGAL